MEHNAKCIRSTNTQHSSGNSLQRRAGLLVIIVDELYCHFRIRLGIERIPGFQKLFLQFLIVLNDSIMYQYDRTILCTMRMRILGRRLSMGCPTGMADTTGTRHGLSIVGLLH